MKLRFAPRAVQDLADIAGFILNKIQQRRFASAPPSLNRSEPRPVSARWEATENRARAQASDAALPLFG
jgi:hypothetical protein